MKTLTHFALKDKYKYLQSVGDKLAKIDSLIDWKSFRTIFESIYFNKIIFWSRPEADAVIRFKMLVLQQWHGFFDFEIEKQCIGRISFRKYLDFPGYIPDRTPVWSFKKRAVKKHPLGIRDILRNKRISSKRVPEKWVYSVTKKIFKAGTVLVATIQRANLKMLCTVFCYNLYQLRTLKINSVS